VSKVSGSAIYPLHRQYFAKLFYQIMLLAKIVNPFLVSVNKPMLAEQK